MTKKHKKKHLYLQDQRRLCVVAIIVFSLFSFLIIQFYKLQVVEGKKWEKKANLQHITYVKQPCKRGIFFTNNSLKKNSIEDKPVVVDIPKFHLFADPDSIPLEYKDEVIEVISKTYSITEDEGKEKLKKHIYKKSRSRKLLTWLSKENKELLVKWWKPFAKKHKIASNALFFVQDYKRSYPYGKFLGQVLHTVREDRDVLTNQAIPTGGLELEFHDLLKGEEGKRRLLRSPKFSLDRDEMVKVPIDGADIYLTINDVIQAIAEEEIEKAVKYADAKGGWAVVMDPNTGEVLALAQYPFFYPSEYRKFYSDPGLIEHTKVKALTDCHEPGSIFKPISLAIALKANQELKLLNSGPLFDPEEKVHLRKVKFPGRSKPIKDVATSDYLNMWLALQKSSNIYISDIIQRVVDIFGEGWYRDQLSEVFGFGKKTGIELPAESSGFLPTPGAYYSNGRPEWSVPTPMCLAIGYNLLANSFQMLRAFSVIANGGYLVSPTLVKKVVKTDMVGKKRILYSGEENRKKRQVLSHDITETVISAMKFVTKPGGSAFRADVPGFTEAGKTSTSEKIIGGTYAKNVHYSSFVGFAPAKGARIVVCVGIDEPEFRFLPGVGRTHYGGKCAAPVFKEIAKKTLQYLGVEPDDPYGYPKGDPRYNAEMADMNKEVSDLKELFKKWHNIR